MARSVAWAELKLSSCGVQARSGSWVVSPTNHGIRNAVHGATCVDLYPSAPSPRNFLTLFALPHLLLIASCMLAQPQRMSGRSARARVIHLAVACDHSYVYKPRWLSTCILHYFALGRCDTSDTLAAQAVRLRCMGSSPLGGLGNVDDPERGFPIPHFGHSHCNRLPY